MSIFKFVPEKFFSVLSSGNREIYCEALMVLHNMVTFELNIKVEDYIAALISVLEDRTYVLEQDDEQAEGSLTVSGKARLVLNRLIKTGWVDKELLEGSFIEIITPRSYAIAVMRLLSDLGEDKLQEYNSLVFSTYSGLKQAKTEQQLQMYEAILSAKKNTEQLNYELKMLYHGIRGFLLNTQEENKINLLLQNHFEDYKKMSDRIYHPIKTMDSIHRYMTPIQSILTEVIVNAELMDGVCERAISIKKYDSKQEAEDNILEAINYVLDSYQRLVSTINDIDAKHSTYTKSSIEKIRYLMTADQSTKGKLVELLKSYATAINDKKDAIGDMLEANICINSREFLDAKSLYRKSEKNRRPSTEPLAIENKHDFANAAMTTMLEQFKNIYSVPRVHAYVKGLFVHEQNELFSNDFRIANDEEFILLLLGILRAKDKGAEYTVDMGSGHIVCDGYRIPNMIFRKKGGNKHVE